MKKGWQIVKLSELIDVQNGFAFNSRDYSESGNFLMRIGNVQNGYISTEDTKFVKLPTDGSLDRFILIKDDILVSLTGNVGRVGVIQESHLPAALNQRVARISIHKNSPVSRELILHFLYSDWFRDALIRAGHGAAQQNVSTKDLVEIEIPVPPLDEQKRIVALLDEAFENIATAKANTEKNLQNAKALFESQLQSIFCKDASLKKGWQIKKLGSICAFDKKQGMHDGLPYVGLEHIESHTARFIGISEPCSVKSTTFRFSDKHVLYGRLRPYLNKALAPDFEGHCSTEIFPLKPSNNLLRKYLLFWLLADDTCRRVNATCSGARMPRAQMNQVLGFEIPLPTVNEQERIVTQLNLLREEIQNLTIIYQRKIDALDALKKSLLHQAFTGGL